MSLMRKSEFFLVCAAAIVTTLALAGCDGWNPFERGNGMNEKAMNCMSSTPAEMQVSLSSFQAEPVYQVVKEKSQGVLHFELDIPDLDAQKETETLMFISSGKAQGMIYVGPFKARFSVEFDERLTENGPGDSIEFRFFRIKHNQICVQAQQVGELYWQPGATAKVKFLRERYIHKTAGVPIDFEVDIQKP